MNELFLVIFNGAFIISSVVLLAIAVIVFTSRRRELYVIFWGLVSLFLGLNWLFIYLTIYIIDDHTIALIVSKLAFTAGIPGCSAFLGFALSFDGRVKRLKLVMGLSALAAMILLVLFWGTSYMVTGIEVMELGLNYPSAGPLMPLYLGYMAVHTTIPIWVFIAKYRSSTGRTKLQAGYLLVAIVVIVFAGVGSVVTTVQTASIMAIIPTLPMVIAPSLVTYAIIRHQILDLRTMAHRTALWLTVSSLIVVPVTLFLWWVAPFIAEGTMGSTAIIAIVLTIAVWSYMKFIQPRIDHFFNRGAYDTAKVVDEFNHEVLNLRSVKALADRLVQTIKQTMYSSVVMVLVQTTKTSCNTPVVLLSQHDSDVTLVIDPRLCSLILDYNGVIDCTHLDDMELSEEEETAMHVLAERQQAHVLVPIVNEGVLLAMVLMQEKVSLKPYTSRDFELLEQIRPTATVAMANAQLYDELSDLTVSLEQRVEQRTAELRRANEQLIEVDRLKTKFFANITHELRTPLTMIIAPLEELLLCKGLTPTLVDDLGIMHRNAVRLLRQISTLLELATVDSGQLRLKIGEIHLDNLVGLVSKSFDSVARRKGVQLHFEASEGKDIILGDVEKLDQVFSNLVANAIKFTDGGGEVRVSVECDEAWCRVVVADSGIGIAPEHLDTIFDRFAQVDSGVDRKYEGAGIGLSLVKEIVELHDGVVRVASTLGEGSMFVVSLHAGYYEFDPRVVDRRKRDVPTKHSRRREDKDMLSWVPLDMPGEAWIQVEPKAASRTPERASSPASRSVRKPRILVVEDNTDMREYLARALSHRFEVVACPNGLIALEEIHARAPELVLMDVMMPEMDGFEVCRRIKKEPVLRGIPVILVTARKGVDRTLEGFRAGADDYVTKPFNVKEVEARIQVQLELVEMRRTLARQQKGEILDLVAAGLAHEVRNPINAIVNALPVLKELISERSADEDTVDELMDAMEKSADRIVGLCQDMMGVSRTEQGDYSPWDIPGTVESTIRLLKYKYGWEAKLIQRYDTTRRLVGRTSQLNQVMMNLLDNAMKASGRDGAIEIHTEVRGDSLVVTVRDDGPGIAIEDVERVFEPLYTTMDTTESKGLGLFITRRIVEEHGGRIAIVSKRGEGAAFEVVLPFAHPEGGCPL